MRFIAWLITLAENSDRIAEAAAGFVQNWEVTQTWLSG